MRVTPFIRYVQWCKTTDSNKFISILEKHHLISAFVTQRAILKFLHLLLFLFKRIYCDLTSNEIFNEVGRIYVMKKHYEENHVHLCYLCAFSAIYVFIVLFVCVQCYLCVYSVISAVLLMYIQYFFACTMLFMDFYFELFSLNIFNKKPFMPQIRNFLACTYMAFILIRYILALYLPYNLVQAKIDKAKIFQKLFRWWGRKVIMYCIVHFLLLKLHQKSSELLRFE